MAVTVTGGQRGDTPQSTRLMERIRVAGTGDGRPCTRPSRVIADRAYSSRAIRAYLRRRQIPHTTPEKRDQAGPAEPPPTRSDTSSDSLARTSGRTSSCLIQHNSDHAPPVADFGNMTPRQLTGLPNGF
ncbi:hypothetical protein [Streptomyces abikoensis]|uniref:hypothetical protein n=1 Tax=Streptomyces abikoensis TaxID=97398 RepID=UPI003F4D3D55